MATASSSLTSFIPAASSLSTVASLSTVLNSPKPIPSSTHECGADIFTIPGAWSACAIIATNSSVSILSNCCLTAPIIVYNNNCNIYCEARNQILEALNVCISNGFRSAGGSNTSLEAIRCNRAGASYSSLFPANTQNPATRTTGVGAVTTSAGGAVKMRGFAPGIDTPAGVLVVLVILFMSGFLGLLSLDTI